MFDHYPVVFRCWECTALLHSLEALRLHVHRQHLSGFPYRCSKCGRPELSAKALCTHTIEAHGPNTAPEFKRKVSEELKLWQIIAQSIQVEMPTYGDDEDLYDDLDTLVQVPVTTSGGEEVQLLGELQSEQTHLQQVDAGLPVGSMEDHHHMEMQEMDHEIVDDLHAVPLSNLEEATMLQLAQQKVVRTVDGTQMIIISGTNEAVMEAPDEEPSEGVIAVAAEEEVFEQQAGLDGDAVLMDDGAGPSYEAYYSSHEFIEGEEAETFEFVDQDGNPVFVDTDFATKAAREIRMRLTKDRQMEMIVRKVAEEKKDKKRFPTIHQCDICGKVSKYPSKILEHRRSHTGERPFKCPHCSQGFSQRGALNSHIRLHTGEKPYACSWECGKVFSSSSACRMHEKTHAGEKNFVCQFCGQLFSKKYHLERHMRTVHVKLLLPPMENAPEERDGLAAAEEDEPTVRNAVLSVIDEVRADRNRKTKETRAIERQLLQNIHLTKHEQEDVELL